MRVFDVDGDGPAIPVLVAGGFPTPVVTDSLINAVCTWDGRAWGPMNSGLAAVGSGVGVMWLCIHDFDGPGPEPARLIATGNALTFKPVGSYGMNVGWWDEDRWVGLARPDAGELKNAVWQAVSFDDDGEGPGLPKLYVCGLFDEFIDGEEVSYIARWDGTTWRPVGGGVNAPVHSLLVHDPDGEGPGSPVLLAGGDFTWAGEQPAARVATWDGVVWRPMADGLLRTVFALHEFDEDGTGPLPGAVFAGGAFTVPGGNSYVAKWNGTAWSALPGTSIGDNVLGLTSHDPDGDGEVPPQLMAGTERFGRVARYGPAGWEIIGDAADLVETLVSFDGDGPGPGPPELIVSGYVDQISGSAGGAFLTRRFARFGTAGWRTLGPALLASTGEGIYAAVTWDPDGDGPNDPEIVLAGLIDNAGFGAANNIARWRSADRGWEPLGLGLSGSSPQVNSVAAWDPDGDGPASARLVAGGRFTLAGGAAALKVAAWDGTAWSAMPGLMSDVTEVFAHTPVAGGPQEMIAVSANLVYRWTGAGWTRLGTGTSTLATVECLGEMGLAGPDAPRILLVGASAGVHSWNGSSWVGVGALGGPAHAMAVYDVDGDGPEGNRLVAGTTYSAATERQAVLYWTGSAWAAVGSLGGGSVAALAVLERGPGLRPLLVVGGTSLPAPGGGSTSLMGWDGVSWSDEKHGLNVAGTLRALLAERLTSPASASATLLIAGDRLIVPDSTAPPGVNGMVQRWTPAPPPIMVREPRDQWPGFGGSARFEIEARAEPAAALAHAWHRGEEPLKDGPTGAGSVINGATTAILEITNAGAADAGEYWCRVSSACGETRSLRAALGVTCVADLVPDGVVDFTDYLAFLDLYEASDPLADLNGDGVIDFADFLEFLNHYDAGC